MTGRRPQLADRLALAILEHGPDSGSTLARRVAARKAAVIAELETNPRFERLGRGRGSRWRLVGSRIEGAWEPMGTEKSVEPDESLAGRLYELERRLEALERTPTP